MRQFVRRSKSTFDSEATLGRWRPDTDVDGDRKADLEKARVREISLLAERCYSGMSEV